MEQLQFYFCEIDSDESFGQLAKSLGGKYLNGFIQLPAPTGSGVIRKISFEDGFHARIWNIKPIKTVVLNKLADPIAGHGKTFHIAYLVAQDNLIIHDKRLEAPFNLRQGNNNIFFSSDANIDIQMPAGSTFMAIDISVTSVWLMREFKDADPQFLSFITQLDKSPKPVTFFESSSATEYRTISDLHETGLSDSKGLLHLKAGMLSLLADFFSKIYNRTPERLPENKILHYDKMIEVEKILVSHLQKPLPSLEAIARHVALSESTLKRHFKQMFGKSLYEYYLEMKMDLAKRMLLEKPLSVNEVAAMLDYEKVSNFIGMFKKHHGFSPGSIRKRSV